jgi:DNA-binding NarL/FixJ family response regulator
MRTVEVYRARVYSKLQVRSAAELATLLATPK